MTPLQVAVHQSNALMTYAIPIALKNNGLLCKMFTDCYFKSDLIAVAQRIDSVTQSHWHLQEKFLRRYSPHLSDDDIYDLGVKGWFYNYLLRQRSNKEQKFRIHNMISDEIAKKMQKYSQNFSHVYCYALSANNCYSWIKNKTIVMDQMHIPVKSFIPIIETQIKLNSEWVSAQTDLYDDVRDYLISQEKTDVSVSDFILAPSEFVRACLVNDLNVSSDKISVMPYPVPAWLYDYQTSVVANTKFPLTTKFDDDQLKILFVGEVGLRKGIPYLLEALRKIDQRKFEMRMVGSVQINSKKVQEYSDICTFVGRLDKRELAQQYQWANLFVFPSLGEGSAGVVNEAMSFGLPVITTQASGSNVRDGIEGRIVSERSVEEIVDYIEEYFKHRSLLLCHAQNAWNRAKEFSLEKTSQRLSLFFKEQ